MQVTWMRLASYIYLFYIMAANATNDESMAIHFRQPGLYIFVFHYWG